VLTSVACSQPGECVAVGVYVASLNQSGLVNRPMSVAEVHGHWQRAQPAPVPADASVPADATAPPPPVSVLGIPGGRLYDAGLESVSCTPSGSCMALGHYSTTSMGYGLAVSGSDGRWGPPQALRPLLDHIDCSAGYCVGAEESPSRPPVVATYAHGHWGEGELVTPPANASTALGHQPMLAGLSCFPGGGCTAAGFFTDDSGHGRLFIATRP
jgi:hypothetical protein